jgi:hypothetical protein
MLVKWRKWRGITVFPMPVRLGNSSKLGGAKYLFLKRLTVIAIVIRSIEERIPIIDRGVQ